MGHTGGASASSVHRVGTATHSTQVSWLHAFSWTLRTHGGQGLQSNRGPQQFQPLPKVFPSFMALDQFPLVSSMYFSVILFKE